MRNNPQILILVGAPGSGKSTFAKYFLRTEENWVRLSRDDFRLMQFSSGNLSPQGEGMVTKMVDSAIESLLSKRTNVLIDATNCKAEYIDEFIDKFNHLADISFKVFDLDEETLQNRCEKRYEETGKYISNNVLSRYLADLKQLNKSFDFSIRPKVIVNHSLVQDASLPKALICDLDGTLSLLNGRNPFDASTSENDVLNEPIAGILRNYRNLGYKILLVSGREEIYKDETSNFLLKHNIPYDTLWMRKSKDYRKDAIIKAEIFKQFIEKKYYIEFVLDDRNQVVDMWRKELRLTCLQVNYGNF